MSYQVFARKYRPKTFDDVLGQDHVVRTLKNAIEQKRLAHAYLFVGPRGTGKTSTARIFAKALNCPDGPKVDFDPDDEICREIAAGMSLDVLEIDGASNNGVEQVRELRETVKFAPARSAYKIYYIDEVHMLSAAAFNALLKTLEEPPAHVKFIFATTEPNKILPTIISRCQRFDLRRIPDRIIAEHLLHIAREEGVQLDEAAAYAIAKGADGGMRDAQSMLDQLVAFCGEKISEANVLEIFGFTPVESIMQLTGHLLEGDTSDALAVVQGQAEDGKDLSRFLADLIGYIRNLLVARVDPGKEFGELAPENLEKLRAQAGEIAPERLLRLIDHFAETEGRMKWAGNKVLHLEVAVIKAIELLSETTLSDVVALLNDAVDAVGGDAGTPAKAARPVSRTAQAKPGGTAKGASSGAAAARGEEVENRKPAPFRDEPPAGEVEAEGSSEVTATTEPEPAPPAAEKAEEAPRNRPKNLSGAALWGYAVKEIGHERPLLSHWVQCATFLQQSDTELVVGFAPDNGFARDSLMADATKAFIEELLTELSGKRLRFKAELREGIVTPEFFGEEDEENVLEDPPEPDPAFEAGGEAAGEKSPPTAETKAGEPARGSKGKAKAKAATGKKGAKRKAEAPQEASGEPGETERSEGTPSPPAEVASAMEENDPLIKDALRIFEAEVES